MSLECTNASYENLSFCVPALTIYNTFLASEVSWKVSKNWRISGQRNRNIKTQTITQFEELRR